MGKKHVHIGVIGNVDNSKSKRQETFRKLYRAIENKDIDIDTELPKSKQEEISEKINKAIEDVKAIDDGER